ncbi:MAG TPA: hypothetical protein VFU26_02115 [Gaiellaceae bacterium]|jgi:hypothetical protein|nr:hypothetical protein [Gaiellaceae bacterium]
MTTIATTALPVADSWTVSVGGGWIVVMLIGMALCFAFMWLMRGGQGWRLCGSRRPLETALTFGEGTVPLDDSRQGKDIRLGTAVRSSGAAVSSHESEVPR